MTMPSMQDKRFRQMLDAAPDAMVVVDQGGSMVAVNREAERLFGWTDAELRGEPTSRLIPQRFQQVYDALGVSDRESPEIPPKRAPVRIFARRRDGSEFPVEIHRSPVGPSEDALFLVTMRDLTEWRDVQESLFRQKEHAMVALASIADAVITTDLAGRITFLHPTAERLTGWRTTEALGQPADTVLTLISDTKRQPMESIPARCLREARAVDLADGVLLLRRDGTEVPIGDSAAPLRDRHGTTIGVVLVFHDVTERRRAARKLSHEATHDALTGLVGRKEFEERLARVLAEAAAGVAEHVLCYLDLDRFKLVNDSCGHEAGDDLLCRISRLLSGRLRSRDTLARLGGDEFGVLLEYCSLTKADEITGKLERASGAPSPHAGNRPLGRAPDGRSPRSVASRPPGVRATPLLDQPQRFLTGRCGPDPRRARVLDAAPAAAGGSVLRDRRSRRARELCTTRATHFRDPGNGVLTRPGQL